MKQRILGGRKYRRVKREKRVNWSATKRKRKKIPARKKREKSKMERHKKKEEENNGA